MFRENACLGHTTDGIFFIDTFVQLNALSIDDNNRFGRTNNRHAKRACTLLAITLAFSFCMSIANVITLNIRNNVFKRNNITNKKRHAHARVKKIYTFFLNKTTFYLSLIRKKTIVPFVCKNR